MNNATRVRSIPFLHRVVGGLLLVALLVPSLSRAQVTEISTQAFLDLISQERAIQMYTDTATTNSADIEAILNATGPNQTYDLRGFSYALVGQGVFRFLATDSEAAQNLPGSDASEFSGAPFVQAVQVSTPDGGFGTTVYQYLDISESAGMNVYGSVIPISLMGFEAETKVVNDPPLQQFALPLQANPATTWEDSATVTSTTTSNFGTTSTTQEVTTDGEVEGYGTLMLPTGTFEVMRVRRTEVRSNGSATTYSFFNPDLATELASVAEIQNEQGERIGFSVVYTEAASSAPIAQSVGSGEEVSFGGEGLNVDLSNSGSAGEAAIYRFNNVPVNNTFSGSATAPSGSEVTPDAVWEGWYYTIRNNGLDNFSATVCINISAIEGVSAPEELVLLTREFASQSWSPLTTTMDGDQVCATVSSFSQFAVGADSDTNTLPVEMASFTATADGSDAVLRWQTASETDNGGFHVEHRTDQGTWTDVGFVEGAGTTDAPQRYRLRVSDLDVGTHTFRLRQVDLDGSAHLSDEVTVRIRPETALFMSDVQPHPVRSQADLVVAVREQQHVSVDVFDLLGRRVKQVHDGVVPAGTKTHLQLDVSDLPSGLYLIRATSGTQQITRKVMVVR